VPQENKTTYNLHSVSPALLAATEFHKERVTRGRSKRGANQYERI